MTYQKEAKRLAEELGLRIASRSKTYSGQIKIYRADHVKDYHALGQTVGADLLYIADDWSNVVAWLQGWSDAMEHAETIA